MSWLPWVVAYLAMGLILAYLIWTAPVEDDE